jgi:hypothetical protein
MHLQQHCYENLNSHISETYSIFYIRCDVPYDHKSQIHISIHPNWTRCPICNPMHQVGRDNVLMNKNKVLHSGNHHHCTAAGVCSTPCSPALRKTWVPHNRQNRLLYSSAAMTKFVDSMSRFFVHLDILYLSNLRSFWWRDRSLEQLTHL